MSSSLDKLVSEINVVAASIQSDFTPWQMIRGFVSRIDIRAPQHIGDYVQRGLVRIRNNLSPDNDLGFLFPCVIPFKSEDDARFADSLVSEIDREVKDESQMLRHVFDSIVRFGPEPVGELVKQFH